jgi:two-component system NtrC family sensor kinase
MLALGQLVSGVTHDLSNPLTSIVGFAQLMLSRSDDPKTRRGLEVIASEAARAARIVQNLLAFARARQPEKSSQDLNALIENTLELKGYDLRVAQIEVDADLDPDLPRIPMDASQIQQVVLNLLVNAAQALRQRESERTIRIATRRRDGGVQLAVEDNGPGLNPADLAKVFDPFFTTRPARTGAGLGLSTCHGMVSEHGGTIRAENRPAGGARFVVELPHTDAEAAAAHEAAPDRNTRARSAAVAGSARPRTILVVDDQPAIQDVLVAMLSQEGHSVDTAGSGDSALRKLRNRSYDMVLSDLRMPGLGGIELYRRLLGDDPWMAERVVFMTGDLFSEESDHFIRTTANLRLAKPFTLDSLRETLRRFDDRFRHD